MPSDPIPPSRREFVVGASASLLAASASLAAASTTETSGSETALTRKLTVATPASSDWPVLCRYDEAHLARLAMPIGGIGTGTISIGGRGNLRDWEVVNKPAKGYAPPNTFFALWCKSQASAGEAIARALEGPIDPIDFEGASGSPVRNHGLPRFRRCNFAAAYPLGQVLLADPDVPLHVRIEAFNPMVPVDTDASGIPIAILRFVLTNPTNAAIDASICGTLENFIGWNGDSGKVNKNVNELKESSADGLPLRGLFMRSTGLDQVNPAWGTLALAALSKETTHRLAWADLSWGDTLLDFWDDFSTDGKLDLREGKREAPFGSLAATTSVPANGSSEITFLIAWHLPNRLAWNAPHERIGNYYCTKYTDAWDVITKTAPQLEDLERRTVAFVRSFVEADVPDVIKEAALFNASTLRTQTAFRSEDGRFFGFEGCNDHDGCCHGSCTHVWNYEQATPFLYGSLSRSMRDTEFDHATQESGFQSFRVNLPLLHAKESKPAAADGQMGTIMRLYRDWRLSGDEDMLKRLWPHAKKALSFAWIKGGWDADRDGVMEGCQHNTMDIEYYGPNPEVGTWYLGALRAAEEMAKHLGDADFAKQCRDLFDRGSKWMDADLFNGEYYEHKIVAPKSADSIADGLRLGAGATNLAEPELQLGAGCLTDQLVGQYVAHVCGLGYLLDKQHIATTLQSVMKYNFCENLFGHFNHMRSYALDDEQGLLVATYPKGRRPKRPFPYAFEVWTGLEYTAAAGMLYEGHADNAIKCIAATRARHEGRKRNPFDEPECGHHYARAMASWATLLAYTGFHYNAVERVIIFNPSGKPATWFWSSGDAWGTIKQSPANRKIDVTLTVMEGTLPLRTITLSGRGSHQLESDQALKNGATIKVSV